MDGKQTILVRMLGDADIVYVIDWDNVQSYFEVSCLGHAKRCENVREVKECFARMVNRGKKRGREK